MNWIGLVKLDVGLDLFGLDLFGLDWIGLDWIGLDWYLNWIGIWMLDILD